jgi:carbamate kinase
MYGIVANTILLNIEAFIVLPKFVVSHSSADLRRQARVAVYAIGGNALSDPTSRKSSKKVLEKVMDDIINLLEAGYRLLITHGNGPQVGDLLMLEETCLIERTRVGLDEWVAATQGMIGHTLSLNLERHLSKKHRPERTAVVLTRVEVDEGDIAFAAPTKPVGPVLDEDTIARMDWDVATTAHGARRVVPSPKPLRILDLEVINSLLELNAVVICAGGGGIPVVMDGDPRGVAAVIDKDRVSALLACDLKADLLVFSTGVDAVRRDFGLDSEEVILEMDVDLAQELLNEGQFPAGSMGPKVEAMIEARINSETVNIVLCQPGDVLGAVRGDCGTRLL